jgi:hypothetical protein
MTTRQTTVHGYVAKNASGTGSHTVLPHVRTVEVKADPSAPFMNRIKKLAEAANDRLNQGKYARAIALRSMAFDVMFAHREWFGTDWDREESDNQGPFPYPERRSALGWRLEDEAFKLLSMNNPVHDVSELWRGRDIKSYIKGTAALSIRKNLDMPEKEKVAKWAENIKKFEESPELVAASTKWIDAYKKNHKIPTSLEHRCPRCGGTGKLDAFKHIDGGICYECDGSGTDDHMHKADPRADLLAAVGLAAPLRLLGPYGEAVRLVYRQPILAVMTKAVISGQQTIDGYTCTSRRHDSGLTVVSIESPTMTLPFHMVVPAREAMAKAREAVKLLKVGKVPMEGTFRRMEIPKVAG